MRDAAGLHEPKQVKRPAVNPLHHKLLSAREFPHSLGPLRPLTEINALQYNLPEADIG